MENELKDPQQFESDFEKKDFEQFDEFQRAVGFMLKEKGYKYKYPKSYQLNDMSMPIDVSKIKNLFDLFYIGSKNGAQEKIWEIQRLLQIGY